MKIGRIFSVVIASIMLFTSSSTALAQIALNGNDLRAIINGTPYYDPVIEECNPSTASSQLSGDDNIAKIYNYLIGKGLKDYQAAGVMGNMQSESGFEPRKVQYGKVNSRGEVSKAGQPSSLDDTPPSGADTGYGIVQFTPATKLLSATDALRQNRGYGDLTFQLDFLWNQFQTNEKPAFNALAATTDLASATVAFETKYERHSGPPQPGRIVQAEAILKRAQTGSLLATTSGGDATASSRPVIVLDPGHAGETISRADPQTGLHDGDYNNDIEREQVFTVATIAKTQLEQVGYQVQLTKQTAKDSVFLRDRANVANNAKATLAVSIHTQGDKPFGTWQEIYTQKVGLFRGAGANKQTFTDAALATKSLQYANAMKQSRDKTEVTSGTTVIKDNDFAGRAPIEPGNIPLVELWAQVPWIYLEAGGNNLTSGLSDQQKAIYASSIVEGVKSSVPITQSTGTGDCNTAKTTGNYSETVLAYAWPEYHKAEFIEMKPAYAKAVKDANSNGIYAGGTKYSGIDCGGFITLLMINSGFEPKYNYSGVKKNGANNVARGQAPWLKANWQFLGNVTSSSELRPGDVAIYKNLAHTFVFVGDIAGFSSKTASSSHDERSPMADKDNVTASTIEWYRKK